MSGEDGSGEGFLDRWSRRKRAGETATPPAPAASPAADLPAVPRDAAPEKTDAELLEELGLPDPDSLGAGDDFKAFMSGAVPARLRNRALRKLWLTNPVLANLDEMVDYGEDFTDAATVVADLKTAYDSVRGMLRTPEPEPAEGAEDETAPGTPPGMPPGTPPEPGTTPDPVATADPAGPGQPDGGNTAPGDPPVSVGIAPGPPEAGTVDPAGTGAAGESRHAEAPAAPRRMRFRFE